MVVFELEGFYEEPEPRRFRSYPPVEHPPNPYFRSSSLVYLLKCAATLDELRVNTACFPHPTRFPASACNMPVFRAGMVKCEDAPRSTHPPDPPPHCHRQQNTTTPPPH